MKILVVVPQSREIPTSYPPYGALYIASWLIQNGYEAEIFNMDINRSTVLELIEKIHEYKPDVVGLSGIVSTSYKYIKQIALAIKNEKLNIPVILGGQLSRAADVVLQNTLVDYVVIGEGEVIMLSLLAHLKGEYPINEVKGIAYRKDGEIVHTAPGNQIRDLDSLGQPLWEMIDMDKYLLNPLDRWSDFIRHGAQFSKHFNDLLDGDAKAFTIMTGRGCTDWCTFCTRNIKGLRKHSHEFLLDMIEHLEKTYNVKFYCFGDESFISSKKWVYEFIEKLKARKLNIAFYILGARVDTVDKELLRALKDAGCFMIEYGFEHGSQRMLDMMEKRATAAENYRVYHWTRELGMYTVPSNVINMPGETQESINESIEFMKSLKGLEPNNFFINYAQAHPGTPLFDYALQTGMISDADEYLEKISDLDAADMHQAIERGVFMNFSGRPIEEVLSWQNYMRTQVNSSKGSNKSKFRQFLVRIRKHTGFIISLGPINYFKKYRTVYVEKIKYRFIKEKIAKSAVNNQTNVSEFWPTQIDLDDEVLMKKIKKFQYTDRKIKTLNVGEYTMDYYEDTYDNDFVIDDKTKITRGPSLREFVDSVHSQSNPSLSVPIETKKDIVFTDTKDEMKHVHMVNLDNLMTEFQGEVQ